MQFDIEPPTYAGGMTYALPTAVSSNNMSVVLRELQTDGQLIGNYSLLCAYTSEMGSINQHSTKDAKSRDPAWQPCVMSGLSGVIPTHYCPGIGHKRILAMTLPPSNTETRGLSVTHVRVQVYSHYATGTQVPTLRDISLYDWSGKVESCV